MKRAANGNLFVIKTLKLVDEEGARDIMIRQEELKKKRRVRKLKKREDKK